jgi:hypothetical protein
MAFLILLSMGCSVCSLLYIACRHIKEIECHLSNCKALLGSTATWSKAGLMGKIFRTSMAADILATPGFYVRRGLADPDEIRHFPIRMKRILKFTWWNLLISFISLLAFECLVRVFDLK